MTKTIEQQAAGTMHEACRRFGIYHNYREAAAALQSAGLLVTERDVLCRKLADAMEAYAFGYCGTDTSRDFGLYLPGPHRESVHAAWSALAAYDREHAPKPPWRATGKQLEHRDADGVWSVRWMPSEADAKAAAEALNALAEGK